MRDYSRIGTRLTELYSCDNCLKPGLLEFGGSFCVRANLIWVTVLFAILLLPFKSLANAFVCDTFVSGTGHSHFYANEPTARSVCEALDSTGFCRAIGSVNGNRPLLNHVYLYCRSAGANDNSTVYFAYPTDPCLIGEPDINTGACPVPPDYIPWDGMPPASVAAGVSVAAGSIFSFRESFVIKNLSDNAGSTNAHVYLSLDDGWDVNDVLIGSMAAVQVPANSAVAVSIGPLSIPEETAADDYKLLWVVNPDDYLPFVTDGTPGTNEEVLLNNIKDTPITVELADKSDDCPSVSCNKKEVGNPVDVATGRKKDRETDYRGAGPFPLTFTRRYDSGLSVPWQFSYTSYLRLEQDRVAVVLDSGQGFVFTMDAGVGTPDPDVPGTLTQVGTDYAYLDAAGTTHVYDNSGRLLSITTRAGFSQILSYTGDDLTSVSDDFGNTITFTNDIDGRFTSMTTPEGEVYGYTYTAAGLLETVSSPDETPLDPADNPTLTYLYESSNLPTGITGIIDENGVRYATYDYNAEGLAILSEHAGGAGRVDLSFGADTTTVTNALGLQTTYHYAEILGLQRITQIDIQATAEVAAASSFRTYDDHGYISTRTDNRGVVTNYTYTHTGNDPANADYFVGLETSRTEAVGTPAERTVATVWNTPHRLPDMIIEQGKTTHFTYDTLGRLTQRTEEDTTTQTVPYTTTGNTLTWTYAYNGAGLMETMNGPRTDVSDITTYTYSPSGHGDQCIGACDDDSRARCQWSANGNRGRKWCSNLTHLRRRASSAGTHH